MDVASGPAVPPDGLITLQTPHVTTGACWCVPCIPFVSACTCVVTVCCLAWRHSVCCTQVMASLPRDISHACRRGHGLWRVFALTSSITPLLFRISYGMCIDVSAKQHAVTISSIKTASSPGLNWGQGGKIRCKVFVTEGGSRGKELDESKWTLVGEDMELVLPLVSWVDANPEYADVPLQQPVRCLTSPP